MTAFRTRLSLVVALLLLTAAPAAPAVAGDALPATRPATTRPSAGDVVSAFRPLDHAVLAAMDRAGATAATAAVFVDGKLVYSRAFGWRDAAKTQPARPDDLMRVASVTKPVTLAIVRTLLREKKLSPDTPAFEYLQVPLPPDADPRLKQVTVGHLMSHKGGWDRATAGDPMFKSAQVQKSLGLRQPPTPADVVHYMAGQPLQFVPGERSAYSNFGYCVLGRVIEKATGKPYAAAVDEMIAKPLKIDADLKLGRSAAKDRDPREVWYPVADDQFNLEAMDAHGGLIASASALCRFMQAYWVGGTPRPKPGTKGQEWAFFGSLPGTTAMVAQRPGGADVAILLNNRRDRSMDADLETLLKEASAAVDAAAAAGEPN